MDNIPIFGFRSRIRTTKVIQISCGKKIPLLDNIGSEYSCFMYQTKGFYQLNCIIYLFSSCFCITSIQLRKFSTQKSNLNVNTWVVTYFPQKANDFLSNVLQSG